MPPSIRIWRWDWSFPLKKSSLGPSKRIPARNKHRKANHKRSSRSIPVPLNPREEQRKSPLPSERLSSHLPLHFTRNKGKPHSGNRGPLPNFKPQGSHPSKFHFRSALNQTYVWKILSKAKPKGIRPSFRTLKLIAKWRTNCQDLPIRKSEEIS